jgi:hypothetical protein
MGLSLAGLALNLLPRLRGTPGLLTAFQPAAAQRSVTSRGAPPPLAQAAAPSPSSAAEAPPLLRRECLDVVRRAPRVDLAFADASGGRWRKQHPHLGATGEDGETFGYVPDEEFLRRDPPPFGLAGYKKTLSRTCSVRDDHYRMLGRVSVAERGRAEGTPRVRMSRATAGSGRSSRRGGT